MDIQIEKPAHQKLSPFSRALASEIQEFSQRMLRTVPLFAEARNGRITNHELTVYLANIKFLLSHTDHCITRARDRSREFGLAKLAAFYDDKLEEENGHEAWANDDLRLREKDPQDSSFRPSLHLENLMRFIKASIDKSPASYLGYVLLTEFFTVEAGGPWLADLDKYCGIRPNSMSAIANHVELDKHHILDDFALIDEYFTDETSRQELLAVARPAMKYFESFCREIEVGAHA